jgi:hypothetical protein
LSEVELMRVGSIVAYLAINWARVVDLNPELKLDPLHYKQLSWLEGQVLYSARGDQDHD